jgi:chromosome segregation ATPase
VTIAELVSEYLQRYDELRRALQAEQAAIDPLDVVQERMAAQARLTTELARVNRRLEQARCELRIRERQAERLERELESRQLALQELTATIDRYRTWADDQQALAELRRQRVGRLRRRRDALRAGDLAGVDPELARLQALLDTLQELRDLAASDGEEAVLAQVAEIRQMLGRLATETEGLSRSLELREAAKNRRALEALRGPDASLGDDLAGWVERRLRAVQAHAQDAVGELAAQVLTEAFIEAEVTGLDARRSWLAGHLAGSRRWRIVAAAHAEAELHEEHLLERELRDAEHVVCLGEAEIEGRWSQLSWIAGEADGVKRWLTLLGEQRLPEHLTPQQQPIQEQRDA